MIYFKHPMGEIFAFETAAEREQFGPPELVAMTPAEVAVHLAPPSPVIPSIVTMRQARLALLQAGKLAKVEAAIQALPSQQKEAALIEWDYSSEVHRNRQFVQMLGAAIGLSNAELDALFVTASGL